MGNLIDVFPVVYWTTEMGENEKGGVCVCVC